MKVNVSIVGVLEDILPEGEDVVEAESLTIKELLDALVDKYGSRVAEEVVGPGGGLRDELCLLVNGRNVLSLPDKFQTPLQDGDEVVITVLVTGG